MRIFTVSTDGLENILIKVQGKRIFFWKSHQNYWAVLPMIDWHQELKQHTCRCLFPPFFFCSCEATNLPLSPYFLNGFLWVSHCDVGHSHYCDQQYNRESEHLHLYLEMTDDMNHRLAVSCQLSDEVGRGRAAWVHVSANRLLQARQLFMLMEQKW